MIRVALIDDHALVRAGFRALLEKDAGFVVVGEAEDGEQGLALLRKEQPDVALLDLHMPGLTGIEVTERVRKAGLKTRLIILTVAGDAPFPRRLLEAGASGYLTKACPAVELIQAVRQVSDGRKFIAPAIAQQLALDAINGNIGSPFEALTARELEVALHFAHGADAQAIARELNISDKTVATHKARVMTKLGIDSEVALAHLAMQHGLLDPSGPPRRPKRK
jgi:DNA-binding NarL/FixJ family response regulator